MKELDLVTLQRLITLHGGLSKFDLQNLFIILKIYENKRYYAKNGIKVDVYINVRRKQIK